MADKVSKFIFPVKNGTQITNKEFDVGGSGDTNTFVGTTAEWNALTTEQQNAYNCRVLTDDDLEVVEIIDNLTSDSSTDALSAKQGKVLKGLVDTTQGQVSDSGDAYDSTRAYAVGDLCIYNNVLYRCITACSAGSWATNQSCFTSETITGVLDKNNKYYTTIYVKGMRLNRIGNVVTINCTSSGYQVTEASGALKNSSGEELPALPVGYRPVNSDIQIWDTNTQKRIILNSTAEPDKFASPLTFTTANLRFTAVWLTNDDFPTS